MGCLPKAKCKAKAEREAHKVFLERGARLQEELIATCDGKSNPLRRFSAKMIIEATDNFDQTRIVSKLGDTEYYKGVIQDRLIMVKVLRTIFPCPNILEEQYRDIVVSSQMSSHKHSLMLLGYCLEFTVPALVYDFVEVDTLNRHGGIGRDGELPWNTRLKIAREVADVVTYLHTAFPRALIHRDIRPESILLDKSWTAKLSSFGKTVAIPKGKQYAKVSFIEGEEDFMDPVYWQTFQVTEDVDVYGFGMLMLVLLTGWPYDLQTKNPIPLRDHVTSSLRNGQFLKIFDPQLSKVTSRGARRQMEACLDIALRCIRFGQDDMPKMIDVAKELRRIEESSKNCSKLSIPETA